MTSWHVRRNGDSVDEKSIHNHSLQLIGFEHKMYMYMKQNGYDWKNKTDQVSLVIKNRTEIILLFFVASNKLQFLFRFR